MEAMGDGEMSVRDFVNRMLVGYAGRRVRPDRYFITFFVEGFC